MKNWLYYTCGNYRNCIIQHCPSFLYKVINFTQWLSLKKKQLSGIWSVNSYVKIKYGRKGEPCFLATKYEIWYVEQAKNCCIAVKLNLYDIYKIYALNIKSSYPNHYIP